MKLTNIILENEGEDKLLKKAKTVYKALKRGKFKVDNQGQREDALFSYRLSDDPTIIKFENLSLDTNVMIKCDIFIKCLNEVANWTKETKVINHVKRKFKDHGINSDIQMWLYNIEPYVKPTEPINEDEDKRIKKARTIYKAFKKGLLHRSKEDGGTIRYILPDEYNIFIRSIDDVLVIKVGKEEDENSIKFFFNSNDGRGERPVKAGPERGYYENFVDKIREKFFYNFDIRLIC